MPEIASVRCYVFRAPIAEAVTNAVGAMSNRPAVFLRVEASDGAFGWGEVFANFPQVGAEHRGRLVASAFAPLLKGAPGDDPAEVRARLEERTRALAIQCGEPGPFAQIIGAVDQAMWDLVARRAGVPLWRHLGARSPHVRVYASGIGPDRVAATARVKHAEGHRAFKLKVGFGPDRDRANLAAMREALGDAATIMLDANQAWTPDEAPERIAELAPFRPHWIEEPILADRPIEAWRAVARASEVPLAAGENIRGLDAFRTMIDERVLGFVQPDVGKWGGVSGGIDVGRLAAAKGVALCPHWLAGGIGLAASMHLLAAAAGPGSCLEVDANPNPLREEVFPFEVREGIATLSDRPGLGVEPDLARLARYLVS